MGMIKIETRGSFPQKVFNTTAEEGGHVMALKRGIEFLTDQLGNAVKLDAELTKAGVNPPMSPLGTDRAEAGKIP